MHTVLVVNQKGGCGKTTVATQLAGAFANGGFSTALADCDRQRSSLEWLDARPDRSALIQPVDWVKDVGAPPQVARLVIDAPAALKAKQTEALAKLANVIIVPIMPSAFDRGSATRFLSKLEEMKRIAKGKIAVGLVANRVRARSRARLGLELFLGDQDYEMVAEVADRAIFQDLAERGLSLFDLANKRAMVMREEWMPLLRFVEPTRRA